MWACDTMSIAIAREAARKLAREADCKLPVNLEDLLAWRGVRLHLEEGWPGQLCARYYPAERLISVNARHPRVRRRFSIAHELGHVALGHEHIDIDHAIAAIFGDEDEAYEKVDGDLEKEANAFAVELLMPRAWVKETSAIVPATELVQAIQTGCDVSQPAAWYRTMEVKVGGFAPSLRRKH